jgi:TolA-binding protein
MNFDRRLGRQDVDAAAIFATARSFRPSTRGRRRALRALGLPVGLSLFGSGLAHAAYAIASSLKGWGIVAGVVATVGAAGGATYVATTSPARPDVAGQAATKTSKTAAPRPARPPVVAAASVPTAVASFAQSEGATADVTATAVVSTTRTPVQALAPALGPAARTVHTSVPVRRLAMRAAPSPFPRGGLTVDGDIQAPPVVSLPERAERPIEPLAPPPFRAASPAIPATTARPSAPSAPSGPSSLNGELALLADAHERLRGGDAWGALAALDRHLRLYPNGALAEEAELLRVRAFIAKGDSRTARKAGETFLQRHPSSPLVARFRSLMNTLDVPTIR